MTARIRYAQPKTRRRDRNSHRDPASRRPASGSTMAAARSQERRQQAVCRYNNVEIFPRRNGSGIAANPFLDFFTVPKRAASWFSTGRRSGADRFGARRADGDDDRAAAAAVLMARSRGSAPAPPATTGRPQPLKSDRIHRPEVASCSRTMSPIPACCGSRAANISGRSRRTRGKSCAACHGDAKTTMKGWVPTRASMRAAPG